MTLSVIQSVGRWQYLMGYAQFSIIETSFVISRRDQGLGSPEHSSSVSRDVGLGVKTKVLAQSYLLTISSTSFL